MLKTDNNKWVRPYYEYLKQFGFSDIKLHIILRDQKDSIVTIGTDEAFSVPSQFTNILPSGNPAPVKVGFVSDSEYSYLSFFRASSEAIHVVLRAEKETITINPILLFHQIESSLMYILESIKKGDEIEFRVDPDLDSLISLTPTHIEGFDSVIFNVLTFRRQLIIGDTEKIVKFLASLISLIPEEHRLRYSFTVNAPYMESSDEIKIATIESYPFLDFEDTINSYLIAGYDIVDLYEGKAYGGFTSDFATTIASLIQEGKHKVAEEKIQEYFDMVSRIKEGDDLSSLSAREAINFDNAEMVLLTKLALNGGVK